MIYFISVRVTQEYGIVQFRKRGEFPTIYEDYSLTAFPILYNTKFIDPEEKLLFLNSLHETSIETSSPYYPFEWIDSKTLFQIVFVSITSIIITSLFQLLIGHISQKK